MFVPSIAPLLVMTNSFRANHLHPNKSATVSKNKSFDDFDDDEDGFGCMPSEVFARCGCAHGDPEFDLQDFDEIELGPMPELPDPLEMDKPEVKSKEPPYNLLFEIYRLGLCHGFGCVTGHAENLDTITSEMNKLAKKFGYRDFTEFDRYFDE